MIKRGIGVSAGIATGRTFIIDRRKVKVRKYHIEHAQIEAEISRLEEALRAVSVEFEQLKLKLSSDHQTESGIGILDAYQQMLKDEYLLKPVKKHIRDEQLNVEWALSQVIREIRERFDQAGAEYFRERRNDVDFIGEQILRNLMKAEPVVQLQIPSQAIIVAYDLSPTDIIEFHRLEVAGIITALGGRTSHSSILAQAFSIPMIVGVENGISDIGQNDFIVIDGQTGEMAINPNPDRLGTYRLQAEQQKKKTEELLHLSSTPAETLDHVKVSLVANVEFPEELLLVKKYGAEGVGLYRKEFLFLDRKAAPLEEEHFLHAKQVLETLAPLPVTFRTLDLGADKMAAFLTARTLFKEQNPALGFRSLRLCLKEKSLFKAQLRGLLRASVFGNMRLMFPMVSGVSDLRAAKEVLQECKDELFKEGQAYSSEIQVGIMVEMPSAVMVADHLAKECDFFSIGTNDLIQYSLAMDRGNEMLSSFNETFPLSILRMIKHTVEHAHAQKKKVGLCGQMAADPVALPFLLGCGVDHLSMNPVALLRVKERIGQVYQSQAQAFSKKILELTDSNEIETLMRRF